MDEHPFNPDDELFVTERQNRHEWDELGHEQQHQRHLDDLAHVHEITPADELDIQP